VLALVLGKGPEQCGLARTGRAGEADDLRLTGTRVELAHEPPALGVVVFNQRDGPRECALVAVEEALRERVVPIGHGASNHANRRGLR
jgi:hypothetical protein